MFFLKQLRFRKMISNNKEGGKSKSFFYPEIFGRAQHDQHATAYNRHPYIGGPENMALAFFKDALEMIALKKICNIRCQFPWLI